MNIDLVAEIRFRCPHCQKLFCTDSSASAVFECSDCHKDFKLNSEKLSTGLYATSIDQQYTFSNCPKCSNLKPLNTDECPSCGVYESKYIEIQKVENPRLYKLNQAWQTVMMDLTQDINHQQFLNLAQTQSALNFAAQKYTDLKKIMGDDALVEKYLAQIELRLEAHVKAQFAEKHNQLKIENPTNLVDWVKSGRIYIFVGLIGTLSLIINRIRPTFPNLNGLVVAITVLSYCLWFTTRPPPSTKK